MANALKLKLKLVASGAVNVILFAVASSRRASRRRAPFGRAVGYAFGAAIALVMFKRVLGAP